MICLKFSYKLTNIALKVVNVGVLTKIPVYLFANVAIIISQTLFAYCLLKISYDTQF